MQKKIVALAVAGLVSGAAFAQSNVTIYGVADVGYFNVSGAGQSVHGLASGDAMGMQTSRLGFKGEEALGNGLKGIFNYETKVVLDNNASTWGTTRQGWVGLASDKLGTFRIGTQSDLTDDYIGGPTEYAYNMSASTLLGQEDGNFSNGKVPGISYKSPNLSGFELAAGYYNPNEKDSNLRQEYYQAGVKYANGPIAAAFTYGFFDDNQFDSSQSFAASGSYDFKVVKLMAGYYLTKDTCASSAGCATSAVRNLDNAMWQIGAQIPVGAVGTIGLGYGTKDNDVKDTDTEAYSIAYMHQLSKRTALYAAYAHIKNDDMSDWKPGAGLSGANFTPGVAANGGESFNAFTLGVNHKF